MSVLSSRVVFPVLVLLLLVVIQFGRGIAATSEGNPRRGNLQYERESCKSGQTPKDAIDTTDRLRRLRLRMKASSYDAYIVPSGDEHQSEFPFEHDQRREYISGFMDPSGFAVILQNSAAFWVGALYSVQVEAQLDCNWIFMLNGQKNVPSVSEWLSRNLSPGAQIGVDSKLMSYNMFVELKSKLMSYGMELVGGSSNLIDDIWSIPLGRAPESLSHLFIHDIIYTGKSYQEKIEELREYLQAKGSYGTIVTSLDETAWLFNLRDEAPIPVFKSYAFVSLEHIRLYVNPLKLTDEIRKYLNPRNCNSTADCVVVRDYRDAFQDIKEVVRRTPGKILLSSLSSYGIVSLVGEEQRKIENGPGPVSVLRSIKNPTEIRGMKKANLKDAVAISDFIARLEKEVIDGKPWDELKAAEALDKYKAQQPLYVSPCGASISAFGPNAAIIHYTPSPSKARAITTKSTYLIDSGAQYLDGTTDITRTFHFGAPTDLQKEGYTRTLMGFINFATTIFPDGITDSELDIIARTPLFDVGSNYLLGTGHGIGTFLNLHEYPIIVAPSKTHGFPLRPGMIMAIEPGYYQKGEFGVRLETVMMVVKANTPHSNDDVDYYTFEPLTFLPFEPKLIKYELLTNKQKEWLNDYNAKIRNIVGLELRRQKRENGLKWLLSRTEYIPVDTCSTSSSQNWMASSYYVALFSLASLYSILFSY